MWRLPLPLLQINAMQQNTKLPLFPIVLLAVCCRYHRCICLADLADLAMAEHANAGVDKRLLSEGGLGVACFYRFQWVNLTGRGGPLFFTAMHPTV